MIRKAVIPAAGYGTRFLPITKTVPKELLPIIDRPALEYIINEAIESGITEILLIVSANKSSINHYFDRNLELEYMLKEKNKALELNVLKSAVPQVKLFYVSQHEQLGLGHAVLQAKEFIGNEPFAVLLGDDVYVGDKKPAIKQLMDAYEIKQSTILGTQLVPASETHKYGICIPKTATKEAIVELSGVVEKPKVAPSRSAISGRYILSPRIFHYLETQVRGAGNEIQLTDAILRSMEEEKVFSYDIIGKRYDIGSKLGYVEAILDFGLKRDELREELTELIKQKAKEIK